MTHPALPHILLRARSLGTKIIVAITTVAMFAAGVAMFVV